MATEYLKTIYTAGATIYFAIWDAAGNVFDTADNVFEAVGTATTPGIAATERTGPGGARSEYRASVNLALVTDAKVPECTVQAYVQAGGSPAPATDTAIYAPMDLVGTGTLKTLIDTVDDFLDTEVAAIKAKTDNLPTDPADASDIASAFGTVNSTLSTIAGYIDTEIASIISTLSTIAGYIDTEVAAIKAKTDNLPSDPADASDIAASFTSIASTLTTLGGYIDTEVAAILAAVDTEVAAIKAKTDNLPSDPADQSILLGAINSISRAKVRFGVGAHTVEGNEIQLIAWLELPNGETVDLTAISPDPTCHALIIPFATDSGTPLLEVTTGDWDVVDDDSLFKFTDTNPAWVTDSKYTAIVTIVSDGVTYSTKEDFYVFP